MYFLVYRGLGVLGIAPPVLGLAALGFLIDHPLKFAELGGAFALAIAGAILAVTGLCLDRRGDRHSLYELPLWVWGIGYVVLGLGLAAWMAYDVSQHGWK
jgi:hypothetical protein